MTSSSSTNKVARVAAKSSNKSKKKGANLLFPLVIVAIVASGIGVIAYARSKNVGTGDNTTPPRAQLADGSAYDHWHAAFAVNVCGKELGPFADIGADVLGIHAHAGEALIHIHPFSVAAASLKKRMGKFFDQVGLVVTDDGFKTPDGKVYKVGETTCGGKPTELVMAHWTKPMTDPDAKPTIIRSGFAGIRFKADLEAFSLALVPKGETPALPAGVSSLQNPSDAGTGQGIDPSTMSIPDISVDGTEPAASTPEGSDSATSAPDASAPASSAPATSAPAADGAGG